MPERTFFVLPCYEKVLIDSWKEGDLSMVLKGQLQVWAQV